MDKILITKTGREGFSNREIYEIYEICEQQMEGAMHKSSSVCLSHNSPGMFPKFLHCTSSRSHESRLAAANFITTHFNQCQGTAAIRVKSIEQTIGHALSDGYLKFRAIVPRNFRGPRNARFKTEVICRYTVKAYQCVAGRMTILTTKFILDRSR